MKPKCKHPRKFVLQKSSFIEWDNIPKKEGKYLAVPSSDKYFCSYCLADVYPTKFKELEK